ncbi:3-deoxy-manno-octulosonate cytidylyltransferase [Haliangium sp.]|uniref:3-deoxy-manno-octulosonate cytidylyltransferase n=1 Tax=Haliangium sp. TaxID=2663208 RepID=UPI003D109182
METIPFHVIIPARYGSSRLPGKPLRLLAGRPMIEWVWHNAVDAGAREVLVATDDARIEAAVTSFGGRAVMTSPDHLSGTDRLAEAVALQGWPDETIIVNLQGDEPCVPGALLRHVAEALHRRPGVGIATVATPITTAPELFDPNVVKVVVDDAGMARYFSRAPIPWVRDAFSDPAARVGPLPAGAQFLRHLGIYVYRAGTLARLAATPPHPLERAESLEQLRALAIGVDIHVSIIDQAPGHGVDTADDLERVARALVNAGGGEG